MTKEIEEFILLNDTENDKLFLNNAEKEMFIILSDQICMLFEEYNKERYFDKLKLISPENLVIMMWNSLVFWRESHVALVSQIED